MKTLKLAAALAALFALGGNAEARITGTQPTNSDIWCVGPDGAEACVDASGNVVPTTTNDATSGSSSLQWSDVETVAINSGGGALAIGAAGTVTVGAASSNLTLAGRLVLGKTAVGSVQSAAGGVTSSTCIPATSSYETVLSTGLLVLMTSLPNISTTTEVGGSTLLTNGTVLILSSTQTVGGLVFQDEGTLTGSFLQLGAATRQVDLYNTLGLIYDAATGYWHELFFTAN